MNNTATATTNSDASTIKDLQNKIERQENIIQELWARRAYKKLLFIFMMLWSIVSISGVIYSVMRPNVSGFVVFVFLVSCFGCAVMIEEKSIRG